MYSDTKGRKVTSNIRRDLLPSTEQTSSLEGEERVPAEGTRMPKENKPTVRRAWGWLCQHLHRPGETSFAASPQAAANAPCSIQGLISGSLPATAKRFCRQLPFQRVSAIPRTGCRWVCFDSKDQRIRNSTPVPEESFHFGKLFKGKCALLSVTPAVKIRRKQCHKSSQASC